jgi:hypothetical protein
LVCFVFIANPRQTFHYFSAEKVKGGVVLATVTSLDKGVAMADHLIFALSVSIKKVPESLLLDFMNDNGFI